MEYFQSYQRPYRKLIVWREAHALCLLIYNITKSFPSYERFSLTQQMRRSSYSVPTNIAEGQLKKSKDEKDRLFEYSACSLEELHYQSLLSRDLKYITNETFSRLEQNIGKVSFLIMRLRQTLKY